MRGMHRWECLDGLRGLLAVYVMLGHMAPFAPAPAWLHDALSHGGAAVDLFFMLSGLVILASLENSGWRARPFLRARAARLLPAYLPVLGLAMAVQVLPTDFAAMPWIAPAARHMWSEGRPVHWPVDLAAHLTFTHGLFPDGVLPHVWVSLLGAAWSLSTEAQFYLLALLAGRHLPGERLAWTFVAMGGAGLAWAALTPDAWHFSRAFLGNKAGYFALGLASAAIARGERGAWRHYICVLCAVVVLVATQGGAPKALPPLAWTLCLLVQFHPGTFPLGQATHATMRSPALLWLGAISYGIYLVNEPLQKLAGLMIAPLAAGNASLFGVVWWPAATLPPIAAAWALHRWIERPVLRRTHPNPRPTPA